MPATSPAALGVARTASAAARGVAQPSEEPDGWSGSSKLGGARDTWAVTAHTIASLPVVSPTPSELPARRLRRRDVGTDGWAV